MKLQDITVSLELAKELKEAGYPQESLFYWINDSIDSEYFIGGNFQNNEDEEEPYIDFDWLKEEKRDFYSAPTVAELGEALPKRVGEGRLVIEWNDIESVKSWLVRYYGGSGGYGCQKKLADAMAKMWLYLKKEGLL